jgi:hypothetical protein
MVPNKALKLLGTAEGDIKHDKALRTLGIDSYTMKNRKAMAVLGITSFSMESAQEEVGFWSELFRTFESLQCILLRTTAVV